MQYLNAITGISATFAKYDTHLFDGIGPIGCGIFFCVFGIADLLIARFALKSNLKRERRQRVFLTIAGIVFLIMGLCTFTIRIPS